MIFGWILVVAVCMALRELTSILRPVEMRKLGAFWALMLVIAMGAEFARHPLAVPELSRRQLDQDLCTGSRGSMCPYTVLQQVRDPVMTLVDGKRVPDTNYQKRLVALTDETSVAQWLSMDRARHQASYAISYVLTASAFLGQES